MYINISVPRRQELRKTQRGMRLAGAMWSFWDFVYFSGITITTVGFGDILPNSTGVRMIVLFEVLIGVLLLVIVINIVTANDQ
jgi:uncharacterized membrane protein